VSAPTVERVDGLAAVTLDELEDRARLQTRVDRKYVVPTAVVDGLLADLRDRLDDDLRVLRRHQRQELVLDGAVLDRVALVARLEGMLGARVHQVAVQRVDLVNDTTWVDVRFETVPPTRRRGHLQPGRESAGTTVTGAGS